MVIRAGRSPEGSERLNYHARPGVCNGVVTWKLTAIDINCCGDLQGANSVLNAPSGKGRDIFDE